MASLNKTFGSSKVARSYTIDPEVEAYVTSTRGENSASQRVNDLLKRAIAQEKAEQLDREAAAFFGSEMSRAETKAFQKAAGRTLERD
ncbi:MAG: hypothetical protein ABSA96_17575 [Candidatus Acidiferrales bacterium]